MSRFIDKLMRMRQTESHPMGFMVGKASSEKLRMQLIVQVAPDDMEQVSSALSSADAVFVEITKAEDIDTLVKACRAKDGVPTGGWLKASSATVLKKITNAACDFIVFPAAAPLSAIPKDKVGRILELDNSLSDSLLRTVNDLPMEAVLISSKEDESPLIYSSLMLVQRLMYLVSKPVLVPVSSDISEADLQALWDTGVSGVVVKVRDEKTVAKLSELQTAIGKLQPPAYRKKSRVSATLPRLQPETPAPVEEEEEDE
jgi:hypothetical protein